MSNLDKPRRSIIEIEYNDGAEDSFEVTATPAIIKSLVEEAAKTGFFRVYNDDDGMLIRADNVRSIFIRYK